MHLAMSQLEFMQSFVEDLLDFRQLKVGNFLLTNAIFDPNEVMQAVIQIFKPQAKANQINLKFSCEQYLKPPPTKNMEDDCVLINMRKLLGHKQNEVFRLPKLIGDERRLKQVMINLVKNALKFSQA